MLLYDILPPTTMAGRTMEEMQQETCEYYSRRTTENLALRIDSIDQYSTPEKDLMDASNIKVRPHFVMMVSGQKEWVLDFVDKKFVLKERNSQ